MPIVELSSQNFDEAIEKSHLTVVDFWAPWCGPCLAFASIFEQISTYHPETLFAKVDIDKEKQLADDFNVQSIPYIMIFRHEFAVFAEAGVQTATNLNHLIEEAKKIDINSLRKKAKE